MMALMLVYGCKKSNDDNSTSGTPDPGPDYTGLYSGEATTTSMGGANPTKQNWSQRVLKDSKGYYVEGTNSYFNSANEAESSYEDSYEYVDAGKKIRIKSTSKSHWTLSPPEHLIFYSIFQSFENDVLKVSGETKASLKK